MAARNASNKGESKPQWVTACSLTKVQKCRTDHAMLSTDPKAVELSSQKLFRSAQFAQSSKSIVEVDSGAALPVHRDSRTSPPNHQGAGGPKMLRNQQKAVFLSGLALIARFKIRVAL
jgi:hypothetical protein